MKTKADSRLRDTRDHIFEISKRLKSIGALLKCLQIKDEIEFDPADLAGVGADIYSISRWLEYLSEDLDDVSVGRDIPRASDHFWSLDDPYLMEESLGIGKHAKGKGVVSADTLNAVST